LTRLGTERAVSRAGDAITDMGQYEVARRLVEDILARRRRVLGEDHPDTQTSASNLAAGLQTPDQPNNTCDWRLSASRTPPHHDAHYMTSCYDVLSCRCVCGDPGMTS
jgi:hypothetical protein